jgi:heat-inducible transcriptional repressor
MVLTERQKNILDELLGEYIETAKPISSEQLEKRGDFDFCSATIRNELKKLSDMGYLEQPHTSAGRIPTDKAYKYFVDSLFQRETEELFSNIILKEIRIARQRIEEELKLAEELTKSLEEMSAALTIEYLPEKDDLFEILTILGPSKNTSDKNISLINSLIRELENF